MNVTVKPEEYTILETDKGPMVSHSRISVYDVLELEERGKTIDEICTILELLPIQVTLALNYINEHREVLTAELRELLIIKREREAYYRAMVEEIRAKFPPSDIHGILAEKRRRKSTNNGHSE